MRHLGSWREDGWKCKRQGCPYEAGAAVGILDRPNGIPDSLRKRNLLDFFRKTGQSVFDSFGIIAVTAVFLYVWMRERL
jgi:hypothetical protein